MNWDFQETTKTNCRSTPVPPDLSTPTNRFIHINKAVRVCFCVYVCVCVCVGGGGGRPSHLLAHVLTHSSTNSYSNVCICALACL